MFSPSLFGGWRVLVVRDGQDAKKDLVAASAGLRRRPGPGRHRSWSPIPAEPRARRSPTVCGRGCHGPAGREADPAPRTGRLRPRRGAPAGGRCPEDAAEALLAAVGNDLRELAAACSQLVADTDGRLTRRRWPATTGAGPRSAASPCRRGHGRRRAGALEALRWALHIGVDPVPIADALADGVRTVARVAAAGRGTPTNWPARWACRRGRSSGRSGRAAVDGGRSWRRDARAAVCNAEVKGGSDDRAYALERAVFAMVSARRPAR